MSYKFNFLLPLLLLLLVFSCFKEKTEVKEEKTEVKEENTSTNQNSTSNTTNEKATKIYIRKAIDESNPVYKKLDSYHQVKLTPAKGHVIDGNLHLRAQPDSQAESLKLMHNGEEVLVLNRSSFKEKIGQENAFWFEVQTQDELTGYAYGAYVKTDEPFNMNIPYTGEADIGIHDEKKQNNTYTYNQLGYGRIDFYKTNPWIIENTPVYFPLSHSQSIRQGTFLFVDYLRDLEYFFVINEALEYGYIHLDDLAVKNDAPTDFYNQEYNLIKTLPNIQRNGPVLRINSFTIVDDLGVHWGSNRSVLHAVKDNYLIISLNLYERAYWEIFNMKENYFLYDYDSDKKLLLQTDPVFNKDQKYIALDNLSGYETWPGIAIYSITRTHIQKVLEYPLALHYSLNDKHNAPELDFYVDQAKWINNTTYEFIVVQDNTDEIIDTLQARLINEQWQIVKKQKG